MTSAISVHVRLRPHTPKDGLLNEENLIVGAKSISATSQDGYKQHDFQFDKCHGQRSTQEDVFEHVQPLLARVFYGYNASIFAYGVTGSGKTHTMQGTESSPGIIPRVVQDVFRKRASLSAGSTMNVSFSYVEILKDGVYDLLGGGSGSKKLDLRTDEAGNLIVADLNIASIESEAEFQEIYQAAAKTRKTASTNLNSSSSRSHAILTLHIYLMGQAAGKATQGKICLTDLAGSENNNLTGNNPERMRESAAINKSLTVLGNVVDAIKKNASRIPYRDSKLTRILQDALGGSSLGLLFCCLAPGQKFSKDTINTLKFASRAKEVENRLNINEKENNSTTKHRATVAGRSSTAGRLSIGGARPTSGQISTVKPATAILRPRSVQNQNIPSVPASKRLSCGVVKGKEYSSDGTKPSITAEIKAVLTRDDVKVMIEPMWQSKQIEETKVQPAAVPQPTQKEDISDANLREGPGPEIVPFESLSEEEKQRRSRVFLQTARFHQNAGQLDLALKYYQAALECIPDHRKLAQRVTNIKMAIEGIVPPPQLSKRSLEQMGHRSAEDGGASSSAKRCRANSESPVPPRRASSVVENEDGHESRKRARQEQATSNLGQTESRPSAVKPIRI